MNILDSYSATGNDYESFCQELTDVVSSTDKIRLTNYKFKLLSFQGMDGDKYVFALIDETAINKFNNFITPLPKVTLSPKEEERPFFDEVVKTSGLILIDDNNGESSMLMVAQIAVPSLADRAGVTGDLIQRYSLVRNLYIAQGLFVPWERTATDKFESTIVFRKQYLPSMKIVKKAFAFMGSHFVYSSLQNVRIICDAIMMAHPFGHAECRQWKINHRGVEIFLEFPEEGKRLMEEYGLPDMIIPGICISDSDIGKQSFAVSHTFRFEDSDMICVFDTENWKHVTDINERKREIIEYISLDFIRSFKEIPKNLAEKTAKIVRIDKVNATYKSILKEAQFVDAIGKKKTTVLNEKILADMLESKQYPVNMYDCIKAIINQAENLPDLPDYALSKLRLVCGKLPSLCGKDITIKWEG